MGSVGHLLRFLFERVEFVVKGGGGGGKGRITSKTRQIRDPVHLETRIRAVCRNYAPIYFIIYSTVNTFIFVLTF